MEDTNIIKKAVITGGLIFFGLLAFVGSFTFIGAGNVGVITRFGAVNRVANPGLVMKIPFIENAHSMETRTQKEQADASAASSDLQEVKSTIALNYHLRGEKAVEVYQNVGEDYKIRIIDPAVQEAFKATTAKFTAQDLIGKREAVKLIAYEELKTRLEKYNIVVDDFNIVNFDFSAEFNQAIEQKVKAQQKLEQTKIEADTAIAQAKGQADAQKALKDTGSLSPEYLQFLALKTWNGILPLYWGGGALPFLNVGK